LLISILEKLLSLSEDATQAAVSKFKAAIGKGHSELPSIQPVCDERIIDLNKA
jgi:hypothetical protein